MFLRQGRGAHKGTLTPNMRLKQSSREFKTASHLIADRSVVGTLHSESCLRRALRLSPGSLDFLEIRADHFAGNTAALERALPRLKIPLLLTARHPAEGGANDLGLQRRRELLLRYLPFAAIIDVELRSVGGMQTLMAMARGHGIPVIVSSHHFKSTPTSKSLGTLLGRAQEAGADLFKVATRTSTPGDVGALLSLLERPSPLPLSVMGMGPYGKISRLLLARAGSVLNYGYVSEPNASGQWEARVLKERIAEVMTKD